LLEGERFYAEGCFGEGPDFGAFFLVSWSVM